MTSRGVSARRSCQLLGLSRSGFAYRAKQTRNTGLVQRLKELASEQPRLGCRLAWAQLRDEFSPLNIKRVRRLWRLEKLHLRPKKSQKISGRKKPELEAKCMNHVWCMDFCHDRCMNSSKLKCLAVVDEFSRECVCLEVSNRIPSLHLIQALEIAFLEYGKPAIIRCDNGPEFISWNLRLFLKKQGVELVNIQPGSPWQNGFAESFIATFRSNCLDAEVFYNLADAQIKIQAWKNFYNTVRPHSGIGYSIPQQYKKDFIKR
jgi:putative transposase